VNRDRPQPDPDPQLLSGGQALALIQLALSESPARGQAPSMESIDEDASQHTHRRQMQGSDPSKSSDARGKAALIIAICLTLVGFRSAHSISLPATESRTANFSHSEPIAQRSRGSMSAGEGRCVSNSSLQQETPMPHRVLAASFPALTIAALAVSASMAGTCGDPILGPELVLNGSFESASYSGCANSCFASCGFSVANWIRGGFYTEDLARNSPDGCEYQPFNPNGGEYYISVQGSVCCGCNNNGSIRQDIAVVAGQTYLVELDIVIDEYDSVQLSIGGVVETISPATTATMEWTRVSRVVQCVSSGGQIRIAATGSQSAPN